VVDSGGAITVAELARETAWSRQHLTRRFREEFGLAPKVAGRVVRFERAYRMLRSTPSFVTIAQVAAVCGYYDQAHLDREFKALAGASPSRLLVDDLPSVQAGDVTAHAC
ncbi:MAG: helix-turn-helix domain-containing protein, partial [Ilumatobacteraceae bacterium]